MPVFQMALCLAAILNWCSFFFVYIYIKIHVVGEICVSPSLSEYHLSAEHRSDYDFGFLHIFLSYLTFYQKVDSIKFISQSTLRWELVLRFFTSWRCETSWTTACLAKVHYLSSKMDKLELLNTTRSDISSISALFLWKTWLSSAIPDGVLDPQDYKLIQADRESKLSIKSKGRTWG